MNRRRFFRRVAPALATPFLFGGMRLRARLRTSVIERAAMAAGASDRVLVIIQLEGGNDGLNTIIPIEDPAYYAMRPTLAVAKSEALGLVGEPLLAMHPSMSGMARLYAEGTLAIVENVGYDGMTLSHFAGTEIWNTASISAKSGYLDTGWVGRYLQSEFPEFPTTLPEDPPAIEISPATSSLFTVVGASIGMSLVDPDEFYRLVNAAPGYDDSVDPTSLAGREWAFIDTIDKESRAFAESVRAAYERGANKATYPSGELGRSLSIIARLVAGGLRTRVYKVSLGGFDTHGSQASIHPKLLATLSTSIAAFQEDVEELGVADRVVGMTYSEFGRRPQENGQGTDHGTAAPHFVFGASVDGGRVHGGLPDLASLDAHGNLKHSIDFHCLYASVIAPLFDIGDSQLDTILPLGACDRANFVPLYRRAGVRDKKFSSKQLELFPNPANSVAWLRIPGARGSSLLKMSIVDGAGRVVMGRELRVGSDAVAIDVSSLPSGRYRVLLVDGGSSELMVQR